MSVTHAPGRHVGRPHANPWVVAVVVLAAALVGVGVWVVVDQTRSSSTEGQASAEVVAMLEARAEAFNGGDGRVAAAFYTEDAVMDEQDIGLVTTGREAIAARLQLLYALGLRMVPVGTPIEVGRFVAETMRFAEFEGTGTGEGVLVFQLADNGRIEHQWVIGEARE